MQCFFQSVVDKYKWFQPGKKICMKASFNQDALRLLSTVHVEFLGNSASFHTCAQNRRQKVFNMGDLHLCRGLDILKI